MIAKTTLSAKGQVVIPKDVRDELGFRAGQSLDVIRMGSGVLLRPAFQKSGRSTEDILAAMREIAGSYDGPPVSIEDMNATLEQRWRGSALDSDR